jgi:hypothetical protein
MGVQKYAKSYNHGKFERNKSFSMVIEVLKGNNVYCHVLVDEYFCKITLCIQGAIQKV